MERASTSTPSFQLLSAELLDDLLCRLDARSLLCACLALGDRQGALAERIARRLLQDAYKGQEDEAKRWRCVCMLLV